MYIFAQRLKKQCVFSLVYSATRHACQRGRRQTVCPHTHKATHTAGGKTENSPHVVQTYSNARKKKTECYGTCHPSQS